MPEQKRRPNIVWLLTDHHIFRHHHSLGPQGPRLPVYESLCRSGVSFSEAVTVCPLCQPARASMLTGLYPHRHGMTMNSGACGSRREFDDGERLFSHYLRRAGYRAGYFGKWHCGDVKTALDFEFEGWTMPEYGHPYWSEEYARYLDEKGLPQATVDVEWRLGSGNGTERGLRLCDEPHPYQRMSCSGRMTTPVETHEAYFVSHLAAQWLRERAAEGDPFVLRVDVWGPHQPYWVAAPFAGTVDPGRIPEHPNFSASLEDRPAFHRALRDRVREQSGFERWQDWAPVVARAYEHATQVDAAFAQVLAALEECGLAEDTLVIYTADHGDILGAHGGCFDKGSMMVEETMRIPMALRWPGRIPAGAASDRLVSNMDLVPTVLEAAGAELPPLQDGASLLGLARDPGGASWREDLMCEHAGHAFPQFQRMLRHGYWKYVAHLDDVEELYNLQEDPFEIRNLAFRPTPIVEETLRDLRHRLLKRMRAHRDHSDTSRNLAKRLAAL